MSLNTLWVVPVDQMVCIPFDAQREDAVPIELSDEFVSGFDYVLGENLWESFLAYASPVIPGGYKGVLFERSREREIDYLTMLHLSK